MIFWPHTKCNALPHCDPRGPFVLRFLCLARLSGALQGILRRRGQSDSRPQGCLRADRVDLRTSSLPLRPLHRLRRRARQLAHRFPQGRPPVSAGRPPPDPHPHALHRTGHRSHQRPQRDLQLAVESTRSRSATGTSPTNMQDCCASTFCAAVSSWSTTSTAPSNGTSSRKA